MEKETTLSSLDDPICSRGWAVIVPTRHGDKVDLTTIRRARASAIAEFLRGKREPVGMLQPSESLTWKSAIRRGCRVVRVTISNDNN